MMGAHPRAPYRMKVPRAAPERRGLHTAQTSSGCVAHANYAFGRVPGTPPTASNAIGMLWNNGSLCGAAVPVFIAITTDMVQPNGIHNPDSSGGINGAGVGGGAYGPEGAWNMFNQVTWAVQPGWYWPSAQGFCAGIGTNVLTCYYPYTIPVLLP